MIRAESVENTINEYYDEELSSHELLNYEARLALSKCIRDFTNDRCFEYFKISNSIKHVKERNKDTARKITSEFLDKNGLLLFNLYSVGSKSFYKRLSNLLLNLLRNNS